MAIEDFFNQTITVKKAGTTNSFGTKSLSGATVTLSGRVERQAEGRFNQEGRESLISAVIYVAAGSDIAREDRVVLDGEQMLVVEVEKEIHGSGSEHHWKVLIGRRRTNG